MTCLRKNICLWRLGERCVSHFPALNEHKRQRTMAYFSSIKSMLRNESDVANGSRKPSNQFKSCDMIVNDIGKHQVLFRKIKECDAYVTEVHYYYFKNPNNNLQVIVYLNHKNHAFNLLSPIFSKSHFFKHFTVLPLFKC